MIHLSRFLVGIRHNRIFRMQSLSGQLIDKLVKAYPKDFLKVSETQFANETTLSDANNLLTLTVTRDDIIVEDKKIFDWKIGKYVEVNKQKVLDITKGCLPLISEALGLDKDFVRIGIIFEFRVPAFEGIENGNFGKFIFDKFVSFTTSGEKSEGNIRFTYKLKVTGGGLIHNIKDYRNVIVIMSPSKGVDEEGKERDCLFVSVDLQHIYDPLQKSVNVDEYYKFAVEHLKQVVLPELKTKGVEINYE
jgi:hypothetical protein